MLLPKSSDNIINYSVIRSDRKSYGLKVTEDAEIIVKAPWYATQKDIDRIVEEKQKWLINKVNLMRNRAAEKPVSYFGEGGKISYLGDTLSILIDRKSKSKIRIEYLDIIISSNLTDNIKQNLEIWYKHQAKKLFKKIADDICTKHNLSYNNIKLSSPKRRWGSCSSRGNININWRLIMAPERIVHYVIAHELAHTVHMNHSSDFWELTEIIHPKSKESDKWLDNNGHKFDWN